jgi:hypothetical protein
VQVLESTGFPPAHFVDWSPDEVMIVLVLTPEEKQLLHTEYVNLVQTGAPC